MKKLLNSDAECQDLALALEELVENGSARGLRRNSLKFKGGDQDFVEFLKAEGFSLEAPTPWCDRGFFISAKTSSQLGSHPIAGAGLIYLQEPGAMEAVEWLDVKPGDFVLDLCAAPGGKSTQIAEKLQGKGWLVANDPVKARAERLEALLARHGALNASVYSLDPTGMTERFSGCFDKILVDAPCSGESLFAKRDDFRKDVRDVDVAGSARRQFVILSRASEMMKAGGQMVYSTCTYSREENEELIENFLENHPGWELIKDQRRWPHKDRVAGGYTALLQAPGDEVQNSRIFFVEENVGLIKHGPYRWDGSVDEYAWSMAASDPLALIKNFPDYEDLEEKLDWEKIKSFENWLSFNLKTSDAALLMKGQGLMCASEENVSRFVRVTWKEYSLGCAKLVPPGRLNNLLPKVLRAT